MTLARKFVVVPCKKVAKLFRTGFNSSKWYIKPTSQFPHFLPFLSSDQLFISLINSKTVARLATSRIKLLRNKREAQIKQMRRDVALLLQSGQDDTARIRVWNPVRTFSHPSDILL